jgi:hypothetical protein
VDPPTDEQVQQLIKQAATRLIHLRQRDPVSRLRPNHATRGGPH